jgi:hypothetical protein
VVRPKLRSRAVVRAGAEAPALRPEMEM